MNLSSLITACETKDKDNAAWIRTVSFYLYAQFLLVSSQGDADIRIISIIEQVETRANPMSVILVETIIGLDNFKEEKRLSGSFAIHTLLTSTLDFILLSAHHVYQLMLVRTLKCNLNK